HLFILKALAGCIYTTQQKCCISIVEVCSSSTIQGSIVSIEGKLTSGVCHFRLPADHVVPSQIESESDVMPPGSPGEVVTVCPALFGTPHRNPCSRLTDSCVPKAEGWHSTIPDIASIGSGDAQNFCSPVFSIIQSDDILCLAIK